jgi:hypothetical protein
VVILLSVIAQRSWVAINQSPPEVVDDAEYMVTSFSLYQAMRTAGWLEFVSTFYHTASQYCHPSLIPMMSALLYRWLDPSVATAMWVNTLFLILSCIYLFKLVKRLTDGSERTAALAVAIMALFPMTYGVARLYMLDIGHAAVVVMWLYYFYLSDAFTHKRYWLGLGLLLGLALLVKDTFPLFIAGPVAWEILYRVRAEGRSTLKTAIAGLLVVGGIGGLLAFPWYWNHTENIRACIGLNVRFGVNLLPADVIPDVRPTMINFLTWLVSEGISVYFFLLGLVLIGLALLRRGPGVAARRRAGGVSGRGLGFLLAWWIPPFLACCMVRIVRHAFPAFPVLAVLLSLLVAPILPRPLGRRALALAGLLLIPLGNFVHLSFLDVWTRLPAAVLQVDRIGVLSMDSLEFTHKAARERGPRESMLDTLQQHANVAPPELIRIKLYVIKRPLFGANLIFLAMRRAIPLEIWEEYQFDVSELEPTLGNMEQALKEEMVYEFLIVEWPVPFRPALDDLLHSSFREVATFPVPDWGYDYETEVIIYQKNGSPPQAPPTTLE